MIWMIKKNIAAQEYDIPRDMGTSRLSTDVITYLYKKRQRIAVLMNIGLN